MAASHVEAPPGSDEDRAPLIIGAVTALMLISTLVVSLRIYTRKVLLDKFGLDDYLIIGGLLATLGDGVAVIANTRYGAGKHIWTVADDPTIIPLYFRCFYVSIVLYMVALLFIKTTFLAQYYRVFFTQKSRNVFFVVAFIVGGWSLSQVFVGIFLCYPVQGFWDKTIDARCIPTNAQWHINAAGNIATDVIVFIMPLPVIRQLNLPKAQKILLLILFSLGFFTVAISVIRIQYLKLFEDVTWENVAPACWSIAELTTALICASLSTLRPFMSRHFPGLISNRASGNRSSYLRQGDSDNRPGARAARKHWPSDNLISLDSTVDKREHHRLSRKHGYDPTKHSSKDSVMELTEVWPEGLDSASDTKKVEDYERIVSLRSMTMTEVESAAADDVEARGNAPPGRWIMVRHDVHQTKVPV